MRGVLALALCAGAVTAPAGAATPAKAAPTGSAPVIAPPAAGTTVPASSDARAAPASPGWRLLRTLPHDPRRFTQGLLIHDGVIYESSGGYGESAVHAQSLVAGAAPRSRPLDPSHFGEGLAFADGRLIQLTWVSGVALVYDLQLQPTGTLSYDGEGWGLCARPGAGGTELVMSDGSDVLTLRDSRTFAAHGRIAVRDGDTTVEQLNELECVGDLVYANVWHSDRIAVIDGRSGTVVRWLDLSALARAHTSPADWRTRENVLNGIAYDPRSGHFFVTGKRWPALYEIEIGDAAAPAHGAGAGSAR